MSLRDDILSATEPDLELQEFPIPEWGRSVYLKGWSAKEREVFERDFGDLDETDTNRRARVLVRCIRDESGALVFTDADAEALGGKQAGPIARLFAKVMDLSGLKQESLDAAKKKLKDRRNRSFYAELAWHFRYPSVDKFLSEVSSEQINEWAALQSVSPRGEELFYRFMSRAIATLCNCMPLGGKVRADDFLPECWSGPVLSNEVQEEIAAFRSAGIPVVIKSRGE